MNLRASTLSWLLAPFAVCALLLRPTALDALDRVAHALSEDSRFFADVITRPFPLIVTVTRG